jgi:uncharacterized membrane protein YqiK
MQLLQQLPLIIQQAVKPMEKIDSIRIFQVNGLNHESGAGEPNGANGSGGAPGTFPEQVVNSALQYQIAKPIIDAVMKDAGLNNQGITGISQAIAAMVPSAAPNAPVVTAPAAGTPSFQVGTPPLKPGSGGVVPK